MNDDAPIACDLTAMSAEERAEHSRVAEEVLTSAKELRERPGGYAFCLPTETDLIQKAGSFISRERRCCPFFHFTLDVEPDHGPVWLGLTGREGVKQFLRESLLPQLGIETTE